MDRRNQNFSWLACVGALLAALAIGLSAYASHGIGNPWMQQRLQLASMYAFGHGAVLAVLGAAPARGLMRIGLSLLLLGTVLFAGSVAAGALLQWPTALAPVGGISLILGWLVLAAHALRR